MDDLRFKNSITNIINNIISVICVYTHLVPVRHDGNAHFFRVRSVDDHVTGYLATVERDVHPLTGHQSEVGQRLETGADQLGGPVLAPAAGPVVEPNRISGLGTVRGRLDRGNDTGAKFAVIAGRRANARPYYGPLGQPFTGASDQPVPLPHRDRERSVQLGGVVRRDWSITVIALTRDLQKRTGKIKYEKSTCTRVTLVPTSVDTHPAVVPNREIGTTHFDRLEKYYRKKNYVNIVYIYMSY